MIVWILWLIFFISLGIIYIKTDDKKIFYRILLFIFIEISGFLITIMILLFLFAYILAVKDCSETFKVLSAIPIPQILKACVPFLVGFLLLFFVIYSLMHLLHYSEEKKKSYITSIVNNLTKIVLIIFSFISLGYMTLEQFNLWVAMACLTQLLLGSILKEIHDFFMFAFLMIPKYIHSLINTFRHIKCNRIKQSLKSIKSKQHKTK